MVPVIDLKSSPSQCAREIGKACRDWGFFYVVNHGVPEKLQEELESLSREFFALPSSDKMTISMSKGNRAWRGYFPVGGELTSGKPDQKEGIYFGAELGKEHPLVKADTPLHGPNLFPKSPARLKPVVLDYLKEMTSLGHRLMELLSLSLDLPADFFSKSYTSDPLVLFRIFNYPPSSPERWGVGEHTDYGVLTILKQDDSGGLEIKMPSGWVAAPPLKGSFVCNLGDMLDRMTGGHYRSTPHRVKNLSGEQRLSFPFFFDPNFMAPVHPLPLASEPLPDDRESRWDKGSVHTFQGTYGEYLLGKVSRVFPELAQRALKS